ncbi:hypothetical protein CAEBREN_31361 [Caenorhabditis brenneri]|uniref:Uncharacterized protein n=1 Tax=Caenorhabditis brenneri TaxID=135651 RepID=G0PN45_CAEBE|nr:hypothetical protein CAEBREN_31361 [Caenorhabditis brenneri]
MPLGDVAKHIWNHLFLNAVLSVDTFFLLSGIVVAYLFFKQRPKPNQIKSPLTWALFYLHRYLRLTPPYMLFIGFFVVYGPYIQGPYAAWMWNILIRQTDACKNRWWRNLLYINNYDTDQLQPVMECPGSGHFTRMIYQRPWNRCSPYLVGLLTGYLISAY